MTKNSAKFIFRWITKAKKVVQGHWQVESQNVDPVCQTPAQIDSKNRDGMRNPDPLFPLEPSLSITEFQKLIHENQNNNLKRDDLTHLCIS